ncbi:hypothetical protein ACLEDP_00650 [Lonsdalea quercina]|uniref:hypothetical protein n=1 Tax=Lonsdalea quercina TaxID=71657 RepID=UPI003976CEB3
MQQVFVFTLLIIWLMSPGILSLCYILNADSLWLFLMWPLIFSLPFSLRLAAGIERQFRPALTVLRHRRHRTWVHLAPWQPTVGLTPAQVSLFWESVTDSTCRALENNRSVIVSSHLLTPFRARRLIALIEERALPIRYRAFNADFTPMAKAVMQCEILCRQWRWRRLTHTDWPVLVIRHQSLSSNK